MMKAKKKATAISREGTSVETSWEAEAEVSRAEATFESSLGFVLICDVCQSGIETVVSVRLTCRENSELAMFEISILEVAGRELDPAQRT